MLSLTCSRIQKTKAKTIFVAIKKRYIVDVDYSFPRRTYAMYCTTIEIRTKSIEISVSDSSSTDDKTYDDGSWDESEDSVALSSSSRIMSNDVKDDVTQASYSDMSNSVDNEKWKILDKPTATTDESEFSLSLEEGEYYGRNPVIGSSTTESGKEDKSSL